MTTLNNDWDVLLEGEFQQEYYHRLRTFLQRESARYKVFPPEAVVFETLRLTPLAKVKVVILGQDPYPGEGQADGLAFSVPIGVKLPPSLINVYVELQRDLGCFVPNNGSLRPWARQGVLLLNTTLTVRGGRVGSHCGRGWETFTDRVIEMLSTKSTPIVFLLWGRHAQAKAKLISNPHHKVLTAAHPSPLSSYRGFVGCRHFSQANGFLQHTGQQGIEWQIPNV